MPDFDFDVEESDLQIGIEVEFPKVSSNDEYLVSRGESSNDLNNEVSNWPRHIGGHTTYDGTVGLEIVSDVLSLEDAPMWYVEALEHMKEEYNADYQPTGLMKRGSTAGQHIHISSLSESQARELYEISQEPWAKVLFCSSIASDSDNVSWPVFRGGQYCEMNFGRDHYDVVNSRAGGRYEWRLPEPMVPEHLEILVKFLRLFEHDPDVAREYAQGRLNDGDERITSIQRAEAIGMDIDEMPVIRRAPVGDADEDFFSTVSENWKLPEIYTVRYNGTPFFIFQSRLSGVVEANGVQFHTDEVYYADTLEEAGDDVANDVERAFRRRSDNELRETEATKELKKIVKEKKA